jgi:DNA-binding NarL/FixJ family response regulator
LPIESARRRVRNLPTARRSRKITLVVASPFAEDRRRWTRPLQKAIVVCDVAERSALDRVMGNLKPDILLVDLALPGLRRIRGLRDIQRVSPSTKIVALTDSSTDKEGVLALKAGARGYCARTIESEHLMKAVAAVQGGEIWAPRKLVPGLLAELLALINRRKGKSLRSAPDDRLERLTARQRVVADLISRGASNKEIAVRLKISERTVKAHLTEAFRNVGVSDRLKLALLMKERSSGPGH